MSLVRHCLTLSREVCLTFHHNVHVFGVVDTNSIRFSNSSERMGSADQQCLEKIPAHLCPLDSYI